VILLTTFRHIPGLYFEEDISIFLLQPFPVKYLPINITQFYMLKAQTNKTNKLRGP
jgi:hypothetical protein